MKLKRWGRLSESCRQFFNGLAQTPTDPTFDLQLVRRGILPKALKRETPQMGKANDNMVFDWLHYGVDDGFLSPQYTSSTYPQPIKNIDVP